MFRTKDGFVNTSVTDILQSHSGLIYLSDWNGLSSYDGWQFKHFKPIGEGVRQFGEEPDDNYRDIRINGIFEDQSGNIICLARDRRIYFFRPAEEKFYDLDDLYHCNSPAFAKGKINVYILPGGISYIVCDGEFILRNSSGNWLDTQHTTHLDIRDWTRIHNIATDAKGNEWLLTDKGIHIIGDLQFDNKTPFSFISPNNDGVFLATPYG